MASRIDYRTKLTVMYLELESLNTQLLGELVKEKSLRTRVMKPSRLTKYKIQSVERAIRYYEQIINKRAHLYKEWDARNSLYLAEMSNAERQLQIARDASQEIIFRIRTSAAVSQEQYLIDVQRISELGTQITFAEKDISDITRRYNEHQNKRPPYAKFISKEELLSSESEQLIDMDNITPGSDFDIILKTATSTEPSKEEKTDVYDKANTAMFDIIAQMTPNNLEKENKDGD